jgi:spore coat polysaccharide biosynthesis protein SpsF
MKTGVLVQARVKSTRFPYKMILPLPGGPLIQHCLRAAKKIKADNYAILTTEEDAIYFEEICRKEDFDIITGPEEDVLKRFVIAIKKYNLDTVVRVTGDKAFLSPLHTQRLVDVYNDFAEIMDFVYYEATPLKEVTGAPYKASLMIAMDENPETSVSWREHIRPGFIDKYRSQVLKNPPKKYHATKNVKLTIDTREDYLRIRKIYEILYKGEILEIDEIEDLMISLNPSLNYSYGYDYDYGKKSFDFSEQPIKKVEEKKIIDESIESNPAFPI